MNPYLSHKETDKLYDDFTIVKGVLDLRRSMDHDLFHVAVNQAIDQWLMDFRNLLDRLSRLKQVRQTSDEKCEQTIEK